MDGIILFADDNVFNDGFEHDLFEKFTKEYSTIPIKNLKCLEETIKSGSTFKACIIDWEFVADIKDDKDFEGTDVPRYNPKSVLIDNFVYTLIYVYSNKEIPEDDKNELKYIYGNKINYRIKNKDSKIDIEYQEIKDDIDRFDEENKHMRIPFVWSQAINRSVQTIFGELESADKNWIKEIRDTVNNDGGDPTSEVIDIFHNLLSENLIQNQDLRSNLDSYGCEERIANDENTAKLYQRIYYSKILKDAPIMTGDIFNFDNGEYGILITPECEISHKKESQLEFLVFCEKNFDDFLMKNNTFHKALDDYNSFKENKRKNLRKIFNNENSSIQIIPSFPFREKCYNIACCIDFKQSFRIKQSEEFVGKRFGYKLNSPYIHQLRQRFVAYFGKYGVPAIPESLRDYNLK